MHVTLWKWPSITPYVNNISCCFSFVINADKSSVSSNVPHNLSRIHMRSAALSPVDENTNVWISQIRPWTLPAPYNKVYARSNWAQLIKDNCPVNVQISKIKLIVNTTDPENHLLYATFEKKKRIYLFLKYSYMRLFVRLRLLGQWVRTFQANL